MPARVTSTLRPTSTPYRNHGRYVSQVARVNEANVADGFLLPVDAEISTSSAARSAVGR
jgi:hypothetical protein